MRKIDRWLRKERKRSAKLVTVFDMLFANKSKAYLFFRLRYFLLLIAANFSIHLVLFFLLYATLPTTQLVHLVGYWLFTLFFHSLWWGGLEVFRTRIRHHYYGAQTEKIPTECGLWFCFTGLIAGILLLIALTHIIAACLSSSAHLLTQLYIATLLIGLALQITVRTYHSSAFAIRRVWRTPTSMLAAPVTALLVTLLGWPLLGAYTLPLAFLINAGVSCAMTAYYTRLMRSLLHFKSCWPTVKQLLTFLKTLEWTDYIFSALAYAAIRLDAILIFTLLHLLRGESNNPHGLIALFLIVPLIAAGHDWAQLFYFDWKRTLNFRFNRFVKSFDRQLNRFSPIVGIASGLVAALVGYLLFSQNVALLFLSLLPFFALRSLIAYRQIIAFTQFYYFDVFINGILLTGITATVIVSPINFWLKLLLIFLGSLFCLLLITRLRLAKRLSIKAGNTPLNTYQWLYQLQSTEQTVQLYIIKLTEQGSHNNKLAQAIIDNYLTNDEALLIANKKTFAFYKLTENPILSKEQLIPFFAGLAHRINCLTLDNPNQLTLQELAGHLPSPISQPGVTYTSTKQLTQEFLQSFPNGSYFDPSCHTGETVNSSSFETASQLLSASHAWLNNHSYALKQLPFLICCLYRDNNLEVLFTLPRDASTNETKRFKQWDSKIRSQNLADKLAPIEELD